MGPPRYGFAYRAVMQQLAMSDSGGLEIGRKLFREMCGFLLTGLQVPCSVLYIGTHRQGRHQMNTIDQITIRLTPADEGKIRIAVTRDGETVYTRLTKFDTGFVGRVERYLKQADVYRQTAYQNDGLDMVATGAYLGGVAR